MAKVVGTTLSMAKTAEKKQKKNKMSDVVALVGDANKPKKEEKRPELGKGTSSMAMMASKVSK